VAPLAGGAPARVAPVRDWVHTLQPGQRLQAAPAPGAALVPGIPSPRLAARVQITRGDQTGAQWLRVRYPGGPSGWIAASEVAGVPPLRPLSPAVRRVLLKGTASLGTRAATVVRDPWGRTLFAAGTTRPLSLASVTKLATVHAGIAAGLVTPAAARAILTPSDNVLAQRLSNRLGGGSRSRGARRAEQAAAALGARIALADGSGIDPRDRASAGEIVDLLLAVRDQPGFKTLFNGLPIAGHTGTLQDRMRRTSADARLRAKTGTLFDPPRASSLCGYVWPAGAGTAPSRAMVMCMLENGTRPEYARSVQDRVATALTAPGALLG
jgi:hypothetical protein